jgi:RNA polymerase sigma factor FliA
MEFIAEAGTEMARVEQQQRDKLVMENLPQVHYIARRIHDRLPPHVPLEDLVHAGILGLMDAVQKYDAKKNVELRHYAKFRIRGAILDSLREGDWGPRALRRQARNVEQAFRNCKARLGREPNESEVAAEMQLSLSNYQQLLGELRGLDLGSLQAESGDGSIGEERWRYREEAVEDNSYQVCLRSEMLDLLERAIGELPERERRVLALYHFEELTMKEVGSVIGIGESRVSQVHTGALLRLRTRLHDMMTVHPAAAASASPRGPR